MIIVHHMWVALSKRIRPGMIARGTGWRCNACAYESKTVFADTTAAGESHRFHVETWCPARAA